LTVGTDAWAEWARRWQAFQEAYVPDRERQLSVMAEYAALATGGRARCVLDLGAGPGAVADAVLQRCPSARAVAVDFDPWLMELGRHTAAAAERIQWVDADLREPGWVDALPSGPYDAIVTATALHWLDDREVRRLYREAHGLLGQRGILLVADLLPTGSPKVARLAQGALTAHEAGRDESWSDFWRGARAVPEFSRLVDERDRRLLPRRPVVPSPIDEHAAALAQAGFREVGEVWRVHGAAVLAALR
jgi:SAM-dependent methyltransferase